MSVSELAEQKLERALYADHHGWLVGWLRGRLGCRHTAADLSHDAFLRLLSVRRAQPIAEPRAFLSTVAKGLLVNHWRRLEVERAYLAALAHMQPAVAPSPEERALVLETLVRIDALLAGLPQRPRQAFLMAQLDGLGYREIAQRLGVSDRMVKKYMASVMLHCLQAE